MDDVAKLRKPTVLIDDYGNEIKAFSEKQIFCDTRSITRREFYDAAQAGLRPEVVLRMQKIDYEGEEEIEWRGKVYHVMRTYWDDADLMEIYLEERTAQNAGRRSSS